MARRCCRLLPPRGARTDVASSLTARAVRAARVLGYQAVLLYTVEVDLLELSGKRFASRRARRGGPAQQPADCYDGVEDHRGAHDRIPGCVSLLGAAGHLVPVLIGVNAVQVRTQWAGP